MIEIRPDPAHPQGGHALLVLPSDKVQGDTVPVSVRDNYGGRYLGENGFQATQVAFGPYPVRRSGADAEILIGPEIVNQIEEYTPVRLIVGTAQADLSWPDSVVPAPGAPALGGLYRAPAETEAEVALTGTKPAGDTAGAQKGADADPDPPPTAAPDPDPRPSPPAQPAEMAPKKSSTMPLMLGGLALLLVAAGIAYFLMIPAEELPPEPVAVVPEPEPAPEPAPADPCAGEALDSAMAEGFGVLADRLRDCAGSVSADDALLYVERAADAGEAAALTLFGQLYDVEQTDAALETRMGLTFGDAPDRAASYYARAVEAGSERAAELLQVTCTRLEGLSDTLSQGALADYCGPQ